MPVKACARLSSSPVPGHHQPAFSWWTGPFWMLYIIGIIQYETSVSGCVTWPNAGDVLHIIEYRTLSLL